MFTVYFPHIIGGSGSIRPGDEPKLEDGNLDLWDGVKGVTSVSRRSLLMTTVTVAYQDQANTYMSINFSFAPQIFSLLFPNSCSAPSQCDYSRKQ
jgi:hypothetical protein